MTRPCLFTSSIASLAPFSLSFPRCAFGPVTGATFPIFTIIESEELEALSFFPQETNTIADKLTTPTSFVKSKIFLLVV